VTTDSALTDSVAGDDLRVPGKRVIVTSCRLGFGEAVARAFGAAGARVVVADADASRARSVAAEIPGALAVPADMRSPSQAQSLIKVAADTLGGVDVLVNAMHGAHAPVGALEMSAQDFDDQINLNVRSAFLGVKYAVPHMLPGSVIINVASSAARRPRPLQAAYDASVGSLITMTRGLAAELGPRIRVNAVCIPGQPDRPVPMDRPVAGADVAAAVLFLAADRSGFLTGVCLEVDGGLNIE
jgi:3-oxoacyl-[acyl-carrier protein] reductase